MPRKNSGISLAPPLEVLPLGDRHFGFFFEPTVTQLAEAVSRRLAVVGAQATAAHT